MRTPTRQFITCATPADITIGTRTFSLAATSSIGGTVTDTSDTPAVCTVTMVTFGTCSSTTNAAGTTIGGVTYVAAPPVTRTFTANAVQTITFPAIADERTRVRPFMSVSRTIQA